MYHVRLVPDPKILPEKHKRDAMSEFREFQLYQISRCVSFTGLSECGKCDPTGNVIGKGSTALHGSISCQCCSRLYIWLEITVRNIVE